MDGGKKGKFEGCKVKCYLQRLGKSEEKLVAATKAAKGVKLPAQPKWNEMFLITYGYQFSFGLHCVEIFLKLITCMPKLQPMEKL